MTCGTCKKRDADIGYTTCSFCRERGRVAQNKKTEAGQLRAIIYKGGKCAVCGRKYKIKDIYDFHHRDPSTKLHDLNSIWARSWSIVQPELDKCDMLCANCHRLLHWDSDGFSVNKLKAVKSRGSKCHQCGEIYDPVVYDFHHINKEEKRIELNRLFRKSSWPRIEEELRKCIMVCVNCHRVLHAQERDPHTLYNLQLDLEHYYLNGKWSRAEDTLLRQYDDFSLEDIATIFPNRSDGSIRARMVKLGIRWKPPKRIWTPEMEQKAIELFSEGYSYAYVARKLEINASKTAQHLQELGYIRKSQPLSIRLEFIDDYWLGVLLARANLQENGLITFTLSEGDVAQELWETFNLESGGRQFKWRDITLYQFLYDKGLRPREGGLRRHVDLGQVSSDFVRGVFEATSSITKETDIILYNSRELLTAVDKTFSVYYPHNITITTKMTYSGRAARAFCDFIYEGVNPRSANKFARIKHLLGVKDYWLKTEEDFLIEVFPRTTMEELIKLLPYKNKNMITYKAQQLGLRKEKNYDWNTIEDELLRAHYSDYTYDQLHQQFLPQYDTEAIRRRARFLDLTHKKIPTLKIPQGLKDKVLQARKEGKSYCHMATEWNIARRVIMKTVNTLIKEMPLDERIPYDLVSRSEMKMLV